MRTRALLLTCISGILFPGCALYDPGLGDKFDPWEESNVSATGRPQFKKVEGARKLDVALLKSDPEPYRLGPGDKVMIEIADQAMVEPDTLKNAPITTPVSRPNETTAAKNPNIASL